MQETASNRNRIIITSVAVLIAIAIIGLSVMAANNQQTADAQAQPNTAAQSDTSTPATTTPVTTPSTPTPATSSFKDGTYIATGTYRSPGSSHEHITITVTLKNGVITSTSAAQGAQEQEGRDYQSMFIGGYKQLVVGKSIGSVSLSRVSGSSLTSQGFNDAINQIEQQAKA